MDRTRPKARIYPTFINNRHRILKRILKNAGQFFRLNRGHIATRDLATPVNRTPNHRSGVHLTVQNHRKTPTNILLGQIPELLPSLRIEFNNNNRAPQLIDTSKCIGNALARNFGPPLYDNGKLFDGSIGLTIPKHEKLTINRNLWFGFSISNKLIASFVNQSEFQLCDSLQLSAIRCLIRLTHPGNLNDDSILPHRLNDRLCHADRIDALPDYFYSLIQCPLACTARQLQEELRSTSEIQSGLNLNLPRACFILCKERGQT